MTKSMEQMYLVGTSKYCLVLDGKSHKGLCAYTDSDWARNKNDYRSIMGNLLKIAGGAVSWTTQTQKSVALSSTEAEYMAMASSARQVMWVKSLYKEIGRNDEVIPIYADNQGAIFMSQNLVTNSKSKHIDLRYHYIRERILDGAIKPFYVEGSKNTADIFMKNLGHEKFSKFRKDLGLVILDK